LLLGKNIFKAPTAEESRQRIMNQASPDFRTLDERIDDRLNEILQRCLTRDVSKRYATADELMYDLEYSIYHSGYGPTNETLGKFIRELFGQAIPPPDQQAIRGTTEILEHSARLHSKG
jgi:serine/threonine-protein kinase